MSDLSTPESVARLLRLAESTNRKLDALTDCVAEISRRLNALEERLSAQTLNDPEVAETMERITEELETLEEERASQRQSSNMVSFDELSALLGRG